MYFDACIEINSRTKITKSGFVMLWGHERLFHEIATIFFLLQFHENFHSCRIEIMMSNVQVIAAIALLRDDEDEEKENVQECSQWV